MHSFIFPSSFLFLVILILTLDHLPTTFCQGDVQYAACPPVRFRCANFPGLEYPFWGGGRARHCGHPAFELDCGGDVPLITLQSRPYRVLGIDPRSLLITVARKDLWNNTCPSPIYNTDLDYRLFRHPSGDLNLTLSYNCAGKITIPGQPQLYRFDCTVNRSRSDSYFLTEAVSAGGSNLTAQLTCTNNIKVPINQTSTQLLTPTTASEDDLKGVLRAGFGLIWEANDTTCNECGRSGGRCGYNTTTSSFACYCVDRPYPYRCNETDPDPASGVGGCSIFLLVILIICRCWMRAKYGSSMFSQDSYTSTGAFDEVVGPIFPQLVDENSQHLPCVEL